MQLRLDRYLKVLQSELEIRKNMVRDAHQMAVEQLKEENTASLTTYSPLGKKISRESFFNPKTGSIVELRQTDILENLEWDSHLQKLRKPLNDSIYHNENFCIVEAPG